MREIGTDVRERGGREREGGGREREGERGGEGEGGRERGRERGGREREGGGRERGGGGGGEGERGGEGGKDNINIVCVFYIHNSYIGSLYNYTVYEIRHLMLQKGPFSSENPM